MKRMNDRVRQVRLHNAVKVRESSPKIAAKAQGLRGFS